MIEINFIEVSCVSPTRDDFKFKFIPERKFKRIIHRAREKKSISTKKLKIIISSFNHKKAPSEDKKTRLLRMYIFTWVNWN